jgi:hypothetical protein
MATLELRKFDMSSETVADDARVLIIGRRQTGKTSLIRDIAFHHRAIPSVAVVSPTIGEPLWDFVPPPCLHAGYSPALVQDLLVADRRRRLAVGDTRSFLVFGDCMYDHAWVDDDNVRSMFADPSKLIVVAMSYPLGLPRAVRAGVDYVFMFRDNMPASRKRLFDAWAVDVFPSFDVFSQVMDRCAITDHECLVIDVSGRFDRFQDNVFWYKTEPHGAFRVGADALWPPPEEVLVGPATP